MRIDELLGRLNKVRQNGQDGWMACCPAHDDKNPSLSVSEGDGGRVLLKCFAGCTVEEVCAALGVELKELMGDSGHGGPEARYGEGKGDGRLGTGGRNPGHGGPGARYGEGAGKKGGRKLVQLGGLVHGKVWQLHRAAYRFIEWYDYEDAAGSILYRKLRFQRVDPPHDKTFLQVVPAADAGVNTWEFGRASLGVGEVLYRLPRVVAAAAAGGVVWVVEGEKDVRTAEALGLVATCNADGAGKWRRGLGGVLRGCGMVYVVADRDPGREEVLAANPKAKSWWQGQRHVCDVVEDLEGLGVPVKAACLPDVGGWRVNDLTDWVLGQKAGRPEVLKDVLAAELRGVVELAPEWDVGVWREPGGEQGSLTRRHEGAKGSERGGEPQHGGASLSAGGRGGSGKNVGDEEAVESVAWLRRELIQVMVDKDISGLAKKRAMAEVVCGWLGGRGSYFYDISDRGHGTAMWFDAYEKRLHRVAQDYFRSWLSRATGFSREFKDYKMFVSAVEDEALVGEGTVGIEPRRYWHREGDVIYLSNGEGLMARIDAGGVALVDNGTDGVVFEQGYTLEEWELVGEGEAVDPFAVCSVFSGIRTIDKRGPMLVRLWLSGMFGCTGWKPLLVLSGSVGSGKTRVATAFFELLGMLPRVSAIDALGNIKDFWASIDKGGLFCLDNADHHIKWLPDALSVISTGGTFEKKKLYTDTETVTQQARCWAVVTSANPSFAADAGLSDRLITVLLERVERETAESALKAEIRRARSPGLSWLCYMMSRALAYEGEVPKGMNRRHPDWARWAWKIGAAAGMGEEAERALRENEAYKSLFSIQNDALGKFLLEGIREPWKGSGKELCDLLAERCEGFNADVWTVVKVGRALSRMAVALKEVFNFERVNHSGRAVYIFEEPVCEVADMEPLPCLPLGGCGGNVGDVGEESIKSHSNILKTRTLCILPPHPPHCPHSNMLGYEEGIEIDGGLDL